MKKIFLVFLCLYILNFFLLSQEFHIEYSSDFKSKKIYNSNDELVYQLNEPEVRIHWEPRIVQNYLFFLTESNKLIGVDLKTKKKKIIIKDVGDFAVSDDLKYICIGRIKKELKNSIYTTVPEIYNIKTKKIISFKEIDFSFLKSEIGISSDILFCPEQNGFSVGYHWETSIHKFSFFISLDDFSIYKVKFNYE